MRAKDVLKYGLITTGLLSVTYLSYGLLTSWILIRPGRRDYDCIPEIRFGKMHPLTLVASDGVGLHAWVLLSRNASPDNWVLLLHGFRSDRGSTLLRARYFSRRGFNVLLLHFRGHGSSDPAMISYGYHERLDVKAAFEYIQSLRPDGAVHIGIDGVSMGAAAAAYAIGMEGLSPDWLIMESCYDNIRNAWSNRLKRRVGNSLAPLLAWPVEVIVEQLAQLRTEDLDPAKALEKTGFPVLVMAGDAEDVLKMVEIEYLYGSIPEPKRLVIFPGAGHEDLLVNDPKRFGRAVHQFLKDLPSLKSDETQVPAVHTN